MKDTRLEVLSFWFEETPPQLWFQVNEEFDQSVRDRFSDTYEIARLGGCDHWKGDPDGCLALCIVYDQFPRNMYRGTPRAYESDKQAIVVAKFAISRGFDQVITPAHRRFIYLPFEHSENLADQKKSVTLFEKMKEADPLSYDYALKHYHVIERFGRFPHRNKLLKRESTPDEIAFLQENPRGY
jgi:uncharacterized protein (DUF924 family)